jgi:hypothetical protein
MLGILAALVTDGLTIARLVDLQTLKDPDFAYGILILVHSSINLIYFKNKKIFSFSFSSFISNYRNFLSTY